MAVSPDWGWLESLPGLIDQRRQFRRRSSEGCNLARGIPNHKVKKSEVVLANLQCVKLNVELLKIITSTMATVGCVLTPPVDELTVVLIEFHTNAGYNNPDGLATAAHSDAWELKECSVCSSASSASLRSPGTLG